MTYEPRPGSMAQRALVHLESLPLGTELTTSQLVVATGASHARQLIDALAGAIAAGAVLQRQRGGHIRSPFFWSLARLNASPAGASPAADGSQKPDDGAASAPAARAGRKTPKKGANRDASTGQSHGATGSESPNGRGENVARALGAAPAFNTPEPGPRQVLKAEPATADATDLGTPACSGPGGGPMGAWQPAAAGPAGALRIALWSDGTLQIERNTVGGAADLILLCRDDVRQLVEYLCDPAMALREVAA